jgi:hypothetical protein
VITLLTIEDIRAWGGRVLSKAKKLLVREEVQPICFVAPATGNEVQSKIHPGIDVNGRLQVDIAAQSVSQTVDCGGSNVSPVFLEAGSQRWQANTSSTVLGNAGEWFLITSALYEEANAATPTITLFEDSGTTKFTSSIVVTASVVTALTAGYLGGCFVIEGDKQIDVTNGAANDYVNIHYYRIL